MNFVIYNKCRNSVFQEIRRYAGHSKWQNIKHTKQTQDAARSDLFRSIISKMRAAIAETGVTDPSQNTRLAQLIEQAKKANMPLNTLNTFMAKVKNSKENTNLDILCVRCPSKCILILYIMTNNFIKTKLEIANKIKKANGKLVESTALSMFNCACYILTSKDCDLDQAMEDAIHINAQDVEKVTDDDKTYFKFRFELLSSQKNVTQLTGKGYHIISVEDTCLPESTVELNEADLLAVNKLKEKLLLLGEIEKIEDNIANS
ncbi:probable transcriptional regulatory protein Pmob_0807 [Colletes gigas]|uniref:probable transcriptional regulatory protein Pmob_0807 n=1 Tax=Colletes gigas TaxID=935657 RepID=UPI001C9B7077|nr:probable transcriptional regulatory protein Pmob_0807 [Colletes gigas]